MSAGASGQRERDRLESLQRSRGSLESRRILTKFPTTANGQRVPVDTRQRNPRLVRVGPDVHMHKIADDCTCRVGRPHGITTVEYTLLVCMKEFD